MCFPLGGFFTHLVTGGDPRKVMAACSEVSLGSGNHWAPGLRIGAAHVPALPVYHFKWRAGCREYLRHRAETFAESRKSDEVAMRMECNAAAGYLEYNGGRIAVEDPILEFRECNTKTPPPGWDCASARVAEYWWLTRWHAPRHRSPVECWVASRTHEV